MNKIKLFSLYDKVAANVRIFFSPISRKKRKVTGTCLNHKAREYVSSLINSYFFCPTKVLLRLLTRIPIFSNAFLFLSCILCLHTSHTKKTLLALFHTRCVDLKICCSYLTSNSLLNRMDENVILV